MNDNWNKREEVPFSDWSAYDLPMKREDDWSTSPWAKRAEWSASPWAKRGFKDDDEYAWDDDQLFDTEDFGPMGKRDYPTVDELNERKIWSLIL